MSLDGQMERLCALYDEKSDDELQAMFEHRDNLTEVAQEALTQTMRGRGLVGKLASAEGDTVPDEEEATTELAADEVVLYTFDDAFEAREAIRWLGEAGVWQRVATYMPMRPGASVPLGLTVIVRKAEVNAAVTALRAKMGLFPEPETGDGLASPLAGMQEMVLVAMFDRGDGLIAAEALGKAGISYCWRDGSEETQELPDEGTVAIEVREEHLEVATGVVQKALAVRPEAG
jgi:hypothetical protein